MNGLITVGVPLFRKSGSKLVHFPVNNGKQEFLRKSILIFFSQFLTPFVVFGTGNDNVEG